MGDEIGVGAEVTTKYLIRSKQRNTAVHQNRWIAIFPSMVKYVVKMIYKDLAKFQYDTEISLPNTINPTEFVR